MKIYVVTKKQLEDYKNDGYITMASGDTVTPETIDMVVTKDPWADTLSRSEDYPPTGAAILTYLDNAEAARDLFIASYNTTFATLEAKYAAGKTIVYKIGNTYANYASKDDAHYYFYAYNNGVITKYSVPAASQAASIVANNTIVFTDSITSNYNDADTTKVPQLSVIKTALDTKQNSLPSGQSTDKFLHSNSSTGALEWYTLPTYASRPKKGTITLTTSWTGSGPYTQTVIVSGATVTANSRIDLLPSEAILSAMPSSVKRFMIENNDGTLTIKMVGGHPTSAMTIDVVVTEVDV